MADYLDKWKTDFPETINNQTRPTEGIDNTLEFNTDGFPQRITNDPVHAKLENDLAQQLFSNDQRLKDDIDSVGVKDENHEKDTAAHANGIKGNAGSATKLATARTIQTNLASTSTASFNGTANITPGVTGVLPVANGGTGSASEKYVKLAGDTMTGTLTMQNINVKAATKPSAEYQKDIFVFTGSDGNRYGFVRLNHKTNGSHTLTITNVNSNNTPTGGIAFNTDTSGNLTNIQGVTPPTSAYQTEIPTANWVRNFSDALKALINTNPAADKLPYFTGASSAGLTTLSSFARTILDDTNASAVRSTIGDKAQNCGGIVEFNLDANGYAKWANGLIIQWGTANVGSNTVSVPLNIAYTTTYNGVCVDNGNYPTQNAIWSFTKNSLTAFTVSAYWPIDKKFLGGIVHWLTIGK